MNRTCFDNIGSQILPYNVFGGISCGAERYSPSECEACEINAEAMQATFILNRNAYSQSSVEEWERQVFIRNVKSFNEAVNNGYHNMMKGSMSGFDYNQALISDIQTVIANWEASHPDTPIVKLKADYLAERSVTDNLKSESKQDFIVFVIAYILMFLYISLTIGFFPSKVHMRFGLGAVGILIISGTLCTAIGLTFYWNTVLTLISAQVCPFLILAIGADNMFMIVRAEL